jgi:hypothetical protein
VTLGSDATGTLLWQPSRAEIARRDRLLWRVSRQRGLRALRLESPPEGMPDAADAAGLLLAAVEVTRWVHRGWMPLPVELSDALPGGMARLFPFSVVRHDAPPPARAPHDARVIEDIGRSAPLQTLSPEWIALELGLRRVIREIEDPARPRPRHGFPWAAVPHPVSDHSGGRLSTSEGANRRIVYVGPDLALNQHLANLEGQTLEGKSRSTEPHAELGAAFGYPPCCVRAFIEDISAYWDCDLSDEALRGRPSAFGFNPWHFRAINARTEGPAHFLLNPLMRDPWLRPVAHFPCRFNCPDSLALAWSVVNEMLRRSPAVARTLPVYLRSVALVFPDREEAVFIGRPAGESWQVDRVIVPGAFGDALYAVHTVTPAEGVIALDFRGDDLPE